MAQTLIREVTWWQRVTSSLYRQSGHSRTPAELQLQAQSNKESALTPEQNFPHHRQSSSPSLPSPLFASAGTGPSRRPIPARMQKWLRWHQRSPRHTDGSVSFVPCQRKKQRAGAVHGNTGATGLQEKFSSPEPAGCSETKCQDHSPRQYFTGQHTPASAASSPGHQHPTSIPPASHSIPQHPTASHSSETQATHP